jgi:hypothetical protein
MGETNWPNNEREAKIFQFTIVGRPERALIDITRPSGHPISSKTKNKKRAINLQKVMLWPYTLRGAIYPIQYCNIMGYISRYIIYTPQTLPPPGLNP